ncbi:Pentapeptide repeats (9 copies) [uncultured archaeon]|nr:Pentapeptide repeats (9 copies) [uncultured archaeon]
MADELEESSVLKEIPASEILAKIENGEPVEYDHVIIKGNLEVSRLEVPTDEIGKKIIVSLINIRNSLINGASDFNDAIFGEIVDFNGSQFNGMAEFLGTQFNRNVSFAESQFSKEARFAGAQFCEDTTFTHAEFNQFAHFTEAQFIKNTDFFQTQFDKGSDFDKAKFKGKKTSFNGAEFSKFADFDNAKIISEQIEFMGVQFRSGLSFKKARLSGDKIHFDRAGFGSFVAFNETEFSGKEIFFDGSEFIGFTDFSNAQFNGDTSFFNVQFIGATTFNESRFDNRLNLNASSIKHMLFYVSLGDTSRISLKNSDLAFLEVPWALIKDRLDYDDSAYLALIRNYDNQGKFDDADNCKLQYRTKRRKEHLDGLQLALDCTAWWFYGYGVRFYYPLGWLIAIFVISAFLYMLGGQAQFPGAFGLSAVILTTTTQIGSLTGLCWDLSIIERISGWLLMSTFLVALAKKTLR